MHAGYDAREEVRYLVPFIAGRIACFPLPLHSPEQVRRNHGRQIIWNWRTIWHRLSVNAVSWLICSNDRFVAQDGADGRLLPAVFRISESRSFLFIQGIPPPKAVCPDLLIGFKSMPYVMRYNHFPH